MSLANMKGVKSVKCGNVISQRWSTCKVAARDLATLLLQPRYFVTPTLFRQLQCFVIFFVANVTFLVVTEPQWRFVRTSRRPPKHGCRVHLESAAAVARRSGRWRFGTCATAIARPTNATPRTPLRISSFPHGSGPRTSRQPWWPKWLQ